MTTYNKLPYSNQFERGHSFNWAGKWTPGKYYYNNFYITDFVVYKNLLLVCRKDHLATNELEPEIVVTNGQTTDVRSAYWEFIVAVSGDSSYMIHNVTYDSVTKSITIFYGDDKHETFALDIDNNSVYIGTIEPTDTNKLWLDTTDDSNVLLKFYNTSNWDVIASTAVYINATNAYQKPNTGIPESDLASEVLAKLNGTQKVYECQLAEVILPQEGDICVVPGHEDSISISLEPGASLISFNVPYKTLRWAVDESVQTTAIAEIRYKGSLTNYYLYQPIPTGEEDVPTVFGGVIEADRSEFALVWDDDEVFAANLQYISLYSVIPDLAYVYRSGNWERIEDISDVLRYSFQNLTSAQQKQARENILAFPGPFENKTEITSNDSLAKYIRYNYRTPGIYSFTFNGKLSDGDTETGTYKAIVITSSTFTGNQYASISNYASFVLIEPDDDNSPFENRLYRVVERYASGSYRPTYVLEGYYIKPQGGIPASDIANGVIPNVSQFITKSVDDLVNYYTKSQTYTKDEISSLIGSIQQFHYEIYASTETATNPQSNVLYLIGPTGSGSDKYEEYIYTNNTWTKIGDTSIDLSDYITLSVLNTRLADYALSSAIPTSLSQLTADETHRLVTDTEKSTWSGKQDALVSGTTIKTINNISILGHGNIDVSSGAGSVSWGGIGGTLYDQNDLQDALDAKQNTISDLQTIRSGASLGATAYQKPSTGIPVTDLANGVIPIVPTISTDITTDASSNDKTTSPKAVKTFVEGKGYTTNEGTVTGVTVGSTAYTPTNGIVTIPAYPNIPVTNVTVGGISVLDNNIAVIPAIPDVSQFITKSVNDLTNYYTKSQTYTKSEVDALVNAIQGFSYEVVATLPTASADTVSKIYLVPASSAQTNNTKDEYITIENSGSYSWELIGNTNIDLSDYITTQELNTALGNYTTTSNLTTLLAGKQDVISDLSTIRSGAAAGATAYQKPSIGIPKTDLANAVQTSLDKTGTLETQLTALGNRIATIEQYITNGFTSLTVGNLTITSSVTNNGEDDHYEGEGVPAIISSRVGRRYLDIINNNWYTAIGTTTASQWVRDTNSITGNEIIEQNN